MHSFVVSLQFVIRAGFADALKVIAAIWITGIQSPDEPCRYDVVYMPPDICLHSPSLPQWREPGTSDQHDSSALASLGTEAGPQ